MHFAVIGVLSVKFLILHQPDVSYKFSNNILYGIVSNDFGKCGRINHLNCNQQRR